jgi:hypothetical protein
MLQRASACSLLAPKTLSLVFGKEVGRFGHRAASCRVSFAEQSCRFVCLCILYFFLFSFLVTSPPSQLCLLISQRQAYPRGRH